MKISIIEETPNPPPKTIVLELTEEEAELIRRFAKYYADTVCATGTSATAAQRLNDKLGFITDPSKAVYPYTKAFT